MNRRLHSWARVYSGPRPLAELNAERLAELDIESMLEPEEALLGAFAPSTSALAYGLWVPRAQSTRARELLHLRDPSVRDARVGMSDGDPVSALRVELRADARRLRLALLSFVLTPIGAWLGLRYLRRVRALEPRPRDHRATCVVIALNLLLAPVALFAEGVFVFVFLPSTLVPIWSF